MRYIIPILGAVLVLFLHTSPLIPNSGTVTSVKTFTDTESILEQLPLTRNSTLSREDAKTLVIGLTVWDDGIDSHVVRRANEIIRRKELSLTVIITSFLVIIVSIFGVLNKSYNWASLLLTTILVCSYLLFSKPPLLYYENIKLISPTREKDYDLIEGECNQIDYILDNITE